MNQNKTKPAKVSEETVTEVAEVQPKFTRVLLGTFLDPKTGDWTVVKVPFDQETLVMGSPETTRVPGDAYVLEERVYIMQAQNNFFHNEPVAIEVKKDGK